MWKYFILFLFLLPGSTQLWGQPERSQDSREERFERIKEAKEAFLREELTLTEAEATAFFSVYWKYDQQIRSLKRSRHGHGRSNTQRPSMTEAEALEQMMNGRQRRQTLLNLEIEAETAYLEHLPATKVILLDKAEREFREKLLRRLKEGRDGGRN